MLSHPRVVLATSNRPAALPCRSGLVEFQRVVPEAGAPWSYPMAFAPAWRMANLHLVLLPLQSKMRTVRVGSWAQARLIRLATTMNERKSQIDVDIQLKGYSACSAQLELPIFQFRKGTSFSVNSGEC